MCSHVRVSACVCVCAWVRYLELTGQTQLNKNSHTIWTPISARTIAQAIRATHPYDGTRTRLEAAFCCSSCIERTTAISATSKHPAMLKYEYFSNSKNWKQKKKWWPCDRSLENTIRDIRLTLDRSDFLFFVLHPRLWSGWAPFCDFGTSPYYYSWANLFQFFVFDVFFFWFFCSPIFGSHSFVVAFCLFLLLIVCSRSCPCFSGWVSQLLLLWIIRAFHVVLCVFVWLQQKALSSGWLWISWNECMPVPWIREQRSWRSWGALSVRNGSRGSTCSPLREPATNCCF